MDEDFGGPGIPRGILEILGGGGMPSISISSIGGSPFGGISSEDLSEKIETLHNALGILAKRVGPKRGEIEKLREKCKLFYEPDGPHAFSETGDLKSYVGLKFFNDIGAYLNRAVSHPLEHLLNAEKFYREQEEPDFDRDPRKGITALNGYGTEK